MTQLITIALTIVFLLPKPYPLFFFFLRYNNYKRLKGRIFTSKLTMKKILPLGLTILSLLTIAGFCLINPVMGQTQSDLPEIPPPRPWTIESVFQFLNQAANWFFAFIIILAVVMILVAAFYYLTAGGDSKKVQNASKLLMYALVGVGVALLAKTLIYLVCTIALPGGECNLF